MGESFGMIFRDAIVDICWVVVYCWAQSRNVRSTPEVWKKVHERLLIESVPESTSSALGKSSILCLRIC